MRKVLQFVLIATVMLFGANGAQAESKSSKTEIKTPTYMTFGRDDAPVTIMEFASYTCVHCAHYHADNRKWLMKNYVDTGRVKYIMRDFPLDRLAAAVSMIVYHAPESSRVALSQLFYEKQTDWIRSKTPFKVIVTLASLAGMNKEAVEKAVEDQALLNGIVEERKEAAEVYKIDSTPTLTINGQKVAANDDRETLTKMIEAAESAAKAKK